MSSICNLETLAGHVVREVRVLGDADAELVRADGKVYRLHLHHDPSLRPADAILCTTSDYPADWPGRPQPSPEALEAPRG